MTDEIHKLAHRVAAAFARLTHVRAVALGGSRSGLRAPDRDVTAAIAAIARGGHMTGDAVTALLDALDAWLRLLNLLPLWPQSNPTASA